MRTNFWLFFWQESTQTARGQKWLRSSEARLVPSHLSLSLKTLNLLKLVFKAVFLGDTSIWGFPYFSSFSDCSIWRSWLDYFSFAIIAFGTLIIWLHWPPISVSLRKNGQESLDWGGFKRGVSGFSRFSRGSSSDGPGIFPIPFLFLGLLRAHTRNSPERVRDTIRTFSEESGNPPGLEIPGFGFSQYAGGNYRIHDLFGGAWIARNAFFT